MTNEDERRARARQRGRDHINSEAGAVTAEALGALLEAREGEQEANSDEARAAAQGVFLSAQAAFGRATGATDVRRRRMAVEALDFPSGARVEVGEFERISGNASTRSRRWPAATSCGGSCREASSTMLRR